MKFKARPNLLNELISSMRSERESIQKRAVAGYTFGLALRMVWNVAKWVLLFFVIGAFSLIWLMFNMAIGGKGWR